MKSRIVDVFAIFFCISAITMFTLLIFFIIPGYLDIFWLKLNFVFFTINLLIFTIFTILRYFQGDKI